jgi:glutathionyl-hydroquinone reductase
MWHLMMSRLAPRDKSGAYTRPSSEFRNTIAANSPYPAESGRYSLYIGWGCPWAHRTLLVRALKGLEDVISINVVSPSPENGGWIFDSPQDGLYTLADLYQKAEPGYTGRSTVPVLWDSQTQKVVNNESSEIIAILNSQFQEFAQHPEIDLYPLELQETIDNWNEKIYNTVNNGVYRCGFAQSQVAYDEACSELFQTLDEIENALATNKYLCGDSLTLADVRLFTTLFRFDAVYYGLFKCNRRRIVDYDKLSSYSANIYQLPGVAETCNIEVVKRDYYGNLFPLNPSGIIPQGPDLSYLQVT